MKRDAATRERRTEQRRHAAGAGVNKRYGAIDLGTNSCRLLIAVPSDNGFRVLDGYSRVVRLGERVAETGTLSPVAVERTMAALKQCSHRLRTAGVGSVRAVATAACRLAADSDLFLERVRKETGLDLEIITAEEEAALTVAGCGELLKSGYGHSLIFDIGGGSTEIIWTETPNGRSARVIDMTSLPFGVVSLRDEFGQDVLPTDRFKALLARVDEALAPFDARNGIVDAIAANDVRMIGTSGTVTTLGAMYLGLPRYNRTRVDGLEIGFDSIRQLGGRLAAMSLEERLQHPCLGRGRSDLMLMGLVVLRAICERWAIGKLRIADRGLREGILSELMCADGHQAVGVPLER